MPSIYETNVSWLIIITIYRSLRTIPSIDANTFVSINHLLFFILYVKNMMSRNGSSENVRFNNKNSSGRRRRRSLDTNLSCSCDIRSEQYEAVTMFFLNSIHCSATKWWNWLGRSDTTKSDCPTSSLRQFSSKTFICAGCTLLNLTAKLLASVISMEPKKTLNV